MKSKHERSVKANMLRAGRQGKARGPFIKPQFDMAGAAEAQLEGGLFEVCSDRGRSELP